MSPLGKYSDIVASITALILVAAAVAVHLGVIATNVADTSWLDASAGAAIGLILGQRVTTNGAAQKAAAANKRLDKLGAPPADDGTDDQGGNGTDWRSIPPEQRVKP